MRPGPHSCSNYKYFFDEVYDFVLDQGLSCLISKLVAGWVDTWVIDLIANLLAALWRCWLAGFCGLDIVDAAWRGWNRQRHLEDGTQDIGGLLRQPQTGRIRNYVLWAGAATAIVVIVSLRSGAPAG